MDDLPKRLRTRAENYFVKADELAHEAADEIERLRRELAEARSERQREHDLRVRIHGEIERLERELRTVLCVLAVHGRHLDSCGDQDAYNRAVSQSCNCGLDACLAANEKYLMQNF
jgi:chromosome segregation ATPase